VWIGKRRVGVEGADVSAEGVRPKKEVVGADLGIFLQGGEKRSLFGETAGRRMVILPCDFVTRKRVGHRRG